MCLTWRARQAQATNKVHPEPSKKGDHDGKSSKSEKEKGEAITRGMGNARSEEGSVQGSGQGSVEGSAEGSVHGSEEGSLLEFERSGV